MKKILAYTLVAVLLGVATMQAPFALFISEMGTSEMDTEAERWALPTTEHMQKAPSKTEQIQGITSATCFPDILFIAFMLTLGLVIALGVMSYFKRRTLSSSLP